MLLDATSVSSKSVQKYYKLGHVDYQLAYFRKNNYTMNHGYWDENTPDRDSALLNTNRVIAKKLKLTRESRYTDSSMPWD